MTAYRAPDFNERAALSRQAKQKALDKLRAKPKPTEAELAERAAAQARREEAEAERRAAKAQAEAEAKAAADEAAARVAAEAAAAAEAVRLAELAAYVPPKTEAEKKAERDARYAARKSRVK